MERELDDEEQQDLFAWIDKIPLSRPKRNISRDFSDGGSESESFVCTGAPLGARKKTCSRCNLISL